MKTLIAEHILKDSFFAKRFIYFILGSLIGILYGIILSIPTIFSYVLFVSDMIGKEATRVGFGIVLAVTYGSLGSGLFFILFADLKSNRSKMIFGVLGGILLGFYCGFTSSSEYSLNPKYWYIFPLYGVMFGSIGGFFIAKHSKFYSTKIDNLEPVFFQRTTVLIFVLIFIITFSKYPIFQKIESLFDYENMNDYIVFFTNLLYSIY